MKKTIYILALILLPAAAFYLGKRMEQKANENPTVKNLSDIKKPVKIRFNKAGLTAMYNLFNDSNVQYINYYSMTYAMAPGEESEKDSEDGQTDVAETETKSGNESGTNVIIISSETDTVQVCPPYCDRYKTLLSSFTLNAPVENPQK